MRRTLTLNRFHDFLCDLRHRGHDLLRSTPSLVLGHENTIGAGDRDSTIGAGAVGATPSSGATILCTGHGVTVQAAASSVLVTAGAGTNFVTAGTGRCVGDGKRHRRVFVRRYCRCVGDNMVLVPRVRSQKQTHWLCANRTHQEEFAFRAKAVGAASRELHTVLRSQFLPFPTKRNVDIACVRSRLLHNAHVWNACSLIQIARLEAGSDARSSTRVRQQTSRVMLWYV